MRYCIWCFDKSVAKKGEIFLEDDVKTVEDRCRCCGKVRPCVIAVRGHAMYKADKKLWQNFVLDGAIDILRRWDDPDFQEEKAEMIKYYNSKFE